MTARTHTRPPMTAAEARRNVREMRIVTSRRSQFYLLRHALGQIGNLTDEARAVYAARMRELEA